MGMTNGWKRTVRMLKAPKLIKWYKKLVHRKNRRRAKQNPESQDQRLNPWDID